MTSRVDPHVKVLDERVVERAKARGLDALVYAPHFTRLPTIESRAATFSDEECIVLPAREVFTGSWRDRKHVLAMDLDAPVPDFLSLEATMAELARQDAIVLVPHPEYATVSLDRADIERYGDQIDAIETYNPKHLTRHNRRAAELGRRTGIPPFASSYAHLRGTVGEVWTTFEPDFDGQEALIQALRDGAAREIGHRDGPIHSLRCTAERGHLIYENGPSKLAWILRGAKPTNPYHPAYDRRFSEDAVYGRPRIRSFADR